MNERVNAIHLDRIFVAVRRPGEIESRNVSDVESALDNTTRTPRSETLQAFMYKTDQPLIQRPGHKLFLIARLHYGLDHLIESLIDSFKQLEPLLSDVSHV